MRSRLLPPFYTALTSSACFIFFPAFRFGSCSFSVLSTRSAFPGTSTAFPTTFVILGILNWHYICFLLPFYYFGHCLSYLNGYYRHYGGNPADPIAWGVSSYDKLYNWIWFYNGYHAEHHFRPKVHWTRIQAFRDQIIEQQRAAGVRVIKPPHALGFLDPDLPTFKQKSHNCLNLK